MGMVAYCGIFLGLGLIGLYNFAPVASANYGLTFIMDEVVDDAEALCAHPVYTCEFICGDSEDLHDMEALASTMTGAQYFLFVVQLLSIIVMAVGLLAALTYNAKLIKGFIIAMAGLLILGLIAMGALSASDPKPARRFGARSRDEQLRSACSTSCPLLPISNSHCSRPNAQTGPGLVHVPRARDGRYR